MRHADHGVVDGRVAVRMEFSHGGTHDRGALAEASLGVEAQVGEHGVEDAPLDGFEAVADVGQRAAGNNG